MISDIEKILLMRECIDEAELEFFVPSRADKYFFAKDFFILSVKGPVKYDLNIKLLPGSFTF